MGKGEYYYYGEKCLLKDEGIIVRVIKMYKKINGYRLYDIEYQDGYIETVNGNDLERL